MNYKRSEVETWISELKPGDSVVLNGSSGPSDILRVEKVTPTGIVRTNRGSYKLSKWSERVVIYGEGWGHISPVTEELRQEVTKKIEKEQENRRRTEVIRTVRSQLRSLLSGNTVLTYELAARLQEVLNNEGCGYGA